MLVLRTIQELKTWRSSLKDKEGLAFVPTMGALHQGHESLIKAAQSACEHSVVSIFVNPLQFAPTEDLSKYPRTQEADLEICKSHGVSAVFLPTAEEIYPQNSNLTKIIPQKALANCLCGSARPGHFEGVLTVLCKLFNLVSPHSVFFGEKDYQQLLIVKKMLDDLNFGVDLIAVPTLRESTAAFAGLAMSSRNKYLSQEEKIEAARIYANLKKAKTLIQQGQRSQQVIKSLSEKSYEYFEIRHNESLELIEEWQESLPSRLFVAARIGTTRLIDNLYLNA